MIPAPRVNRKPAKHEKPRRVGAWIAVALIAFVLIAGLVYRLLPETGMRLPSVAVTTIRGQPLDLSSLAGKVVLVNFWSTNCAVCIREMPRLTELYRRYSDRGYEMVAVAMAFDPPHRVLGFARRNSLPFIVALDLQGKAAHAFGDVHATPTIFLIDRSGLVVRRYVGAPDFEELERLIKREVATG